MLIRSYPTGQLQVNEVVSEEGKGQETAFTLEELFFSTTDSRGIITAYNQVFVRVSGYSPEELLGSPHNRIRHADMPCGVFQMLWENLKAGKPFAGYVKNRAKTGAYYWVFTVNVPIAEGYLSVRFKPTTALLKKVASLYQNVREWEMKKRTEGVSSAEVARQSANTIRAALKELGYADYTTFSHHALTSEMRSRDLLLGKQKGGEPQPMQVSAGSETQIHRLYLAAGQTLDALDQLFHQLDAFTRLGDELKTTADQVVWVTSDFFLSAMNANISAQHLGEQGLGLGTVARFLGVYGAKLGEETNGLSARILDACEVNVAVTASIATARLQLEMILVFLLELAKLEEGANGQERLHMLKAGLSGTLGSIDQLLCSLQSQMPRVRDQNELLMKTVLNLEVTQISGLTEAARIPEAVELGAMFETFRVQIGEARSGLRSLGDTIDHLAELARNGPRIMVRVKERAGQMQALMA